MSEAVLFIAANWEYITLGILIVDKIVAMSPTKYDDMIFTSIKGLLYKLAGK